MPRPEREPNALPQELADFLKDRPFACLPQATDQGTVLVVKAPNLEIQSVRGRVPIRVVHELFNHSAAPVIRMTVRIYDQPRNPLALETFINVDDSQQRSDYAALANQDTIYLLFYDETIRHRLTKGVNNIAKEDISQVLEQADRLFASIPKGRFDFDRAKAAVMEGTEL